MELPSSIDISANKDISANPNFSRKHEAIIALVRRQTDYSRDTSIQKLQQFEGNYIKVIREYLNPNSITTESKKDKTVNQTIMSEIRYFMDDVNNDYKQRKKRAAIKKRIIQYHMLKRQQEQQQKASLKQDQNKIIKPSEKD